MAREKITFIHSDDFESVDEELTEAMGELDQANDRVLELLRSTPPPIMPGETAGAAAGEDNISVRGCGDAPAASGEAT